MSYECEASYELVNNGSFFTGKKICLRYRTGLCHRFYFIIFLYEYITEAGFPGRYTVVHFTC